MDPLAIISGYKPKVILADGELCSMSSHTTDNVWKVKRVNDHYTCSCPAWIYQKNTPPDARSCRHLKELLGYKYEELRILQAHSNANGSGNSSPSSSKPQSTASNSNSKPKSSKGKKRQHALMLDDSEDDSDNNDDDDTSNNKNDATPRKQPKRNADSTPSSKRPPNSAASITVSVLLAQTWKEDKGCDPTGYWISEKLDGVRAYFTNGAFYSRLGNKFFAPDSYTEDWISKLPKGATLDGELFTRRNNFQGTVSIVRSGASPRWPEVKYHIFDAPFMGDRPFEERLEWLKKIFGPSDAPTYSNVMVVEHVLCKGKSHVMEMLDDLQKKGAEGLMLRQPKSSYENRRSSTLLKVKTFYDAEARVLAHHKGSGKNSNVMGAVEVEMANGTRFRVGSGFTDAQRVKPPKIGSIIVYKFQELSKSGTPRFPTYVGDAIDKTEPKDAEIRAVDADD